MHNVFFCTNLHRTPEIKQENTTRSPQENLTCGHLQGYHVPWDSFGAHVPWEGFGTQQGYGGLTCSSWTKGRCPLPCAPRDTASTAQLKRRSPQGLLSFSQGICCGWFLMSHKA